MSWRSTVALVCTLALLPHPAWGATDEPAPPPATTATLPPATTATPPPATAPPPPAKPAPPPATATPPVEPPEYEPKDQLRLAAGAAYFGSFAVDPKQPDVDATGLLLEGGYRYPVAKRFGADLRVGWALTEWRRAEKWGRTGYKIGEWTTNAYGDVYDWAARKGDDQVFRVFGSFFAFIFLLFPYIIAGLCYLVAIPAPSTYVEFDGSVSYDFGDAKFAPYVRGGLGLFAFIHPERDTVRLGVGPTVGAGVRLSQFNIGGQLTVSPAPLHGEPTGSPTTLLMGGVTVGFALQ